MKPVFNEVELIRHVIETKEYPDGIGLKRFINMVLGYIDKYGDIDKDVDNYVRYTIELLNSIDTLSYPYYQEYKYAGYIKKQAKDLLKGKIKVDLKQIDKINITESEIALIKTAKTENERKLLFTLYVLAKTNTDVTGWVNFPDKIIFEYANLRLTNKQKAECIHSLYEQGLIQINMIIDKHGYKVQLCDDSNVAMTINMFEDFGKQYLDKYKDGWKMCERCHKMIKVKGNRQKYCNKCAIEIHGEQKKASNRRKYSENSDN